jgi:hypothetical protein
MEDLSTVPTNDTMQVLGPVMAMFGMVFSLVGLIVAVVAIIASWKIYSKAGKPGWAAIIPIYNMYVMLQIVGRPGWWILLFFVPLVNMVISILLAIDLARSFGKSDAFGIIGLWLFGFIGYLMLAFGSAKYVGPAAFKTGPVATSPTIKPSV